ncbi:hypothetical protein [Streptomyces sp. NPDC018031]|uniref:hypothetical protein n=1 Tax=Streptomyces sp. NPDC018031 TaxID=3365033 RepID=UPI0037956F6F
MALGSVQAKEWEDFDWAVWQVTVDDPENRLVSSREQHDQRPDLAEGTRQPMTELTASLGCVYEDCCDHDTYGTDDDPYYAWWIRVPQTEHNRRGKDGIPLVIHILRQYLATLLPDQLARTSLPTGSEPSITPPAWPCELPAPT